MSHIICNNRQQCQRKLCVAINHAFPMTEPEVQQLRGTRRQGKEQYRLGDVEVAGNGGH